VTCRVCVDGSVNLVQLDCQLADIVEHSRHCTFETQRQLALCAACPASVLARLRLCFVTLRTSRTVLSSITNLTIMASWSNLLATRYSWLSASFALNEPSVAYWYLLGRLQAPTWQALQACRTTTCRSGFARLGLQERVYKVGFCNSVCTVGFAWVRTVGFARLVLQAWVCTVGLMSGCRDVQLLGCNVWV